MFNRLTKTLAASAALLVISAQSHAIAITEEDSGAALWAAVAGGISGISLNSITLSNNGALGGAISTGTYTNGAGTYGIGGGIVLSSGDVNDYNTGPNTDTGNTTAYGVAATAAQETVLDTITGGALDHNDVTEFTIDFDVDDTVSTIFFDVVFGSDEFDEFVGSSFIDAFGIFLNGANETIVNGFPINIDHPDFAFLGGTELDGILAPGGIPLLNFALSVTPGSTGNVLSFIIADSGDSSLDSTVYISGIGSVPPSEVPVPAPLALIGLAMVGLAARRRQ